MSSYVLRQLREVNRLTRDHRPDDLAEAERIQSEGGEVRRLRPGSGTSRIFAPGGSGKRSPSLALSHLYNLYIFYNYFILMLFTAAAQFGNILRTRVNVVSKV